MTYKEYCERVREIPVSGELEFARAVFWLHPEILPLGLVSAAGCGEKVIKVPERVKNWFGRTVPVIAVAKGAFAGNGNVTDIILPSGIGRIPEGAFAGCRNLRNITVPRKVRRIGEGTFAGCTGLENVFYEGTKEEWDRIGIECRRHETDFGDLIPGTPVQKILSERSVYIPGNRALLTADIHFRCDPGEALGAARHQTENCGNDITGRK